MSIPDYGRVETDRHQAALVRSFFMQPSWLAMDKYSYLIPLNEMEKKKMII